MSQLTAERVAKIFADCVSDPDTEPYDVIFFLPEPFHGRTVTFSLNRVAGYATEIRAMLNQLPASFHQAGQGITLQDAFHNSEGSMWTHDLARVEELLLLGVACIYVRLFGQLGMMDGDPFIIIDLSIE